MFGDALPAGTVTFVFTDIEGSTHLLRRLGAMYAQLLDQHNRILIDTFTRHGGVVFGTEGDAMFVAFGRATAAMAAVVDAQLRLGRRRVARRCGGSRPNGGAHRRSGRPR